MKEAEERARQLEIQREREFQAMSDRIQKKMNMMGEVMKRVNDKSAEDERRAEEERQVKLYVRWSAGWLYHGCCLVPCNTAP